MKVHFESLEVLKRVSDREQTALTEAARKYKENKMTKTDLLPDEIFMSPEMKECGTAESLPEPRNPGWVKYIRADLVSTPNKSAEVDLDDLKREVIDAVDPEMPGIEMGVISMAIDHLATGKGGETRTEKTMRLCHELTEQQKTAEPEGKPDWQYWSKRFFKNGIAAHERVVCVDVPHVYGTVVYCDDKDVIVRWDDGTIGELIWDETVAYNAYRLQVITTTCGD